MPLQNRVTPFGDILAIPERGAWMGNRGILHTGEKVLSGRRWTTLGWVICKLDFKGRKRELMAPGTYTELFFVDEATALSAGHRPCFECRRADAVRFRNAWCAAFGERSVSADRMNRVTHAERKVPTTRRPTTGDVSTLPDGTMICQDTLPGIAWLVRQGRLWRWTPAGYRDPKPARHEPGTILTPASTVAVLAAGYVPQMDDSSDED